MTNEDKLYRFACDMESAISDAHSELAITIVQMMPKDDQIICNRVRHAEGILSAVLTLLKEKRKSTETWYAAKKCEEVGDE